MRRVTLAEFEAMPKRGSHAHRHVLVVGKKARGEWHYLVSDPMTHDAAAHAVSTFGCHDDKICVMRPVALEVLR